MPEIYVQILTADKRFGRMLTIEIESLGSNVKVGDFKHQVIDEASRRFVIADLDEYAERDLDEIDPGCTLIGFSTKHEHDIPSLVKTCNVFLHRPFLITDLLNLISDGEMSDVPHAFRRVKDPHVQKVKNNVLRVNSEKRCAVWGNTEIPLSDNEYKVLEFLCSRRETLILRAEIDELLGVECGNMSDVYICHLRRKLDNKLGLKLICTVRGKGYTLNN